MTHRWRVRVDDAHTRVGDVDVHGDARAMSLRVAYVTVSFNITHTRACCGGGGSGARARTVAAAWLALTRSL